MALFVLPTPQPPSLSMFINHARLLVVWKVISDTNRRVVTYKNKWSLFGRSFFLDKFGFFKKEKLRGSENIYSF